MARSHYVYIAQDGEAVVGAFTVKHELFTWLEKTRPRVTKVVRAPDGLGKDKAPVDMTGEPALAPYITED